VGFQFTPLGTAEEELDSPAAVAVMEAVGVATPVPRVAVLPEARPDAMVCAALSPCGVIQVFTVATFEPMP
jgi:hypothetical protein